MGNTKAVWAVLVGLVALAVLAGAGLTAELRRDLGFLEAAPAVPLALLLALLSLSLAGRAHALHQRTLGRAGGAALASLARGIGLAALVLAATALLALAVFAVLVVAG